MKFTLQQTIINYTSMKKNILLLLLISLIMASHSYAELILGEEQFDPGNVEPAPISAIAGDLLETSVASFTGLNTAALVFNGSTGTAQATDPDNPAIVWGQITTTFTFNTSLNTKGYDIKEIRLFSGWDFVRTDQDYKISYSVVGDPNFVELTDSANNSSIIRNTDLGSLLTRTYDSAGEFILTEVDQLRFDFNYVGTVYREFDVIGSPSPVPEHSNSALIIGVICLTSLLSSRSFLLRPIISN